VYFGTFLFSTLYHGSGEVEFKVHPLPSCRTRSQAAMASLHYPLALSLNEASSSQTQLIFPFKNIDKMFAWLQIIHNTYFVLYYAIAMLITVEWVLAVLFALSCFACYYRAHDRRYYVTYHSVWHINAGIGSSFLVLCL